MKVLTDVDIDVLDRNKILEELPHISASMKKKDGYTKHNTGVYFQPIPFDPRTNVSTINYKEANDLGYFKLDLINNSVYEGVKSEEHLVKLMTTEPDWSLLEQQQTVKKLFHISRYPHLLKRFKPVSIEELAMVLAIIRPAKAYLQECDWAEVKQNVWTKEGDEYVFKKAHAISYAAAIVVQLNLLSKKAS